MTLIPEIKKYRRDDTEHTDPINCIWGVDPHTACALCKERFNLGEATIAFDTFDLPARSLDTVHYHPACLDMLVAVVMQDMAALVEAKGFVVGTYIARRRDKIRKALDTIVFAGTVQLPPSNVR